MNHNINDHRDNNNDNDNTNNHPHMNQQHEEETKMIYFTNSNNDDDDEMMNQNQHENEEEDNNNISDQQQQQQVEQIVMKQCFTMIQQRRFGSIITNTSVQLCPSMDLMIFGTITGTAVTTTIMDQATTLHLHRTVTWQKLVTFTAPQLTTTTTSSSTIVPSTQQIQQQQQEQLYYTHTAWRPDGRFVAVTDTMGRIGLYCIEQMLANITSNNNTSSTEYHPSPGSTNTTTTTTTTTSLDEFEGGSTGGRVHILTLPATTMTTTTTTENENDTNNNNNNEVVTTTTTTGLTWSHVGKSHPLWAMNQLQQEQYSNKSGWKQTNPTTRREEQKNKLEQHEFKEGRMNDEHDNDSYLQDYINICYDPENQDEDCTSDEEVDIMWYNRLSFVDREMDCLPTSDYYSSSGLDNNHNHNDTDDDNNATLPSSMTPLSILYVTTCVTTKRLLPTPIATLSQSEQQQQDSTSSIPKLMFQQQYYLHLYLHGRYPIALNLNFDSNNNDHDDLDVDSNTITLLHHHHHHHTMVTSPDLSHVVILERQKRGQQHNQLGSISSSPFVPIIKKRKMILYTIPGIVRNRYTFQQIGTLYSKIHTHLGTIQKNIIPIMSSYKSSMKPLDLKLDVLKKLMEQYGVLSIPTTTKKKNNKKKGTTSNNSDSENESDDDDDEESTTKEEEEMDGTTKLGQEEEEVPTTLRTLLVHYILSGQTRTRPTLSNAMDQYFTSVVMNDPLLVRLDRSISSAMSNVETMIKQMFLAPVLALQYCVDTLRGIISYRPDLFFTSTNENNNNNNNTTERMAIQEWICSIELLMISIETSIKECIDIRFRLRDCIAWLRSVSSEVKARGTALNSVQRENAKKRRVTDAVVKRMLFYLSSTTSSSSSSTSNHPEDDVNTKGSSVDTSAISTSTTEEILGLKFSSLFQRYPSFVVTEWGKSTEQQQQQPMSDLSNVVKSSETTTNRIRIVDVPIVSVPTIPTVLEKVIQGTEQIFLKPQLYVKKSVSYCSIMLDGQQQQQQEKSNHQSVVPPIAITTRLGRGRKENPMRIIPSYYNFGEKENPSKGCFIPRQQKQKQGKDDNAKEEGKSPYPDSFRQWLITANVAIVKQENDTTTSTTTKKKSGGDNNGILIQAVPLKWTKTKDNDDYDVDDDFVVIPPTSTDDDMMTQQTSLLSSSFACEYQWCCQLLFPTDCTIQDVSFYGDDGKSSLVSSSGAASIPSFRSRGQENNHNNNNKSHLTTTGEEGQRQSLGVLLNRTCTTTSSVLLELWMIQYDHLPYDCRPIQRHTTASTSSNNNDSDSNQQDHKTDVVYDLSLGGIDHHKYDAHVHPTKIRTISVRAMTTNDDEDENNIHYNETSVDEDEDTSTFVVVARTRTISTQPGDVDDEDDNKSKVPVSCSQLVLSGSRGIGAIVTTLLQNSGGIGGTSMELFDLEENDEDDEEDAEEEEENDDNDNEDQNNNDDTDTVLAIGGGEE